MCGRFSITGDLDFYAEYFGADEILTEPLDHSWNIAPTDQVYVIAEREGTRQLGTMRWGLIPHWATDTKSIHVNARSETVDSTPAFRDSFARKRCIIPADGFYEWESPEAGRTPHWVYRGDGHPMAFAGIWASRQDPATGAWERTCSILTAAATGAIGAIHDRMPVALQREVWDAWLDRELTDPELARGLIRPIPSNLILEHRVSRRVNSVKNNGPDLKREVAPETLF